MNKKVLCFGDSNTWGYVPGAGGRYPKGVRWPGKLAEISGWEIIEEGLNGRTSAFIDQLAPYTCGASCIEACVGSHQPLDLLIIMLGTNDMKTYICNCPHASAAGIIDVARKANALSLDAGFKTLIVSPVAIAENCFGIESTMLQLGTDCVENMRKLPYYLEPMAEASGYYFLDAAKYASASQLDAIHMAPEGHAALAEAIYRKALEILGE